MRVKNLQGESRARNILRGETERDVRGAEFLKTLIDDALGKLGFVALAAEVTEIKMAQVSGHDLFGAIGGGFVGEMAVATENALFEAPGTTHTVLQHFHIVIGFQDEDVGGADALDNQLGDVAEISEKTNVGGLRAQEITDRVLRVVWNGKRFDKHVANFKTRAGGEQAAIEFGAELKFHRLLRFAIAVYGNLQFVAQNCETLNMIHVFVRDENAGEIFGRATDGSEALADLARAESGINQDAGFVGFEIGAIAIGTAAKNRQVNSHTKHY
jgi:hypothetical protein